jgi:hypothetical protein
LGFKKYSTFRGLMETRWEQSLRNLQKIIQSRNMAENIEAFIHSVPWDLKCPNPPPKAISR